MHRRNIEGKHWCIAGRPGGRAACPHLRLRRGGWVFLAALPPRTSTPAECERRQRACDCARDTIHVYSICETRHQQRVCGAREACSCLRNGLFMVCKADAPAPIASPFDSSIDESEIRTSSFSQLFLISNWFACKWHSQWVYSSCWGTVSPIIVGEMEMWRCPDYLFTGGKRGRNYLEWRKAGTMWMSLISCISSIADTYIFFEWFQK